MKNTEKRHGLLFYIVVIAVALFVGIRAGNLVSSLFNENGSSVPGSSPSNNSSTNNNALPDISKEIIYDDDTVTVRVNGLDYEKQYGSYYFIVRVTIKNNSPYTISFECNAVDVNGYTIETYGTGDIYSGMKADADLYLPKDLIELTGVKEIQTIEGTYTIRETDENEVLCEVPIEIKSSAFGSYEETYSFSGTTVVDNEEYRIVLLPVNKPTTKNPVGVYVENKTDYPISVSYHNLALNDKMVLEMMSGFQVLSHSHAIRIMEVLYWDNEPKDIGTIESVTLGFTVLPIKSEWVSSADMIDIPGVTLKY